MSTPRIYLPTPLQTGSEVALDARAVGHVVRVLRLRVGDELTLFNGASADEYRAQLIDVRKDTATCHILSQHAHHTESPLTLELAQGISRGERMDYTIQKAVELGVQRIVPLTTERSQVKLSGEREEKRLQHWTGIILHACEQSGRHKIPELLPVQRLDHWLASRTRTAHALFLDPEGDVNVGGLSGPVTSVSLLVGPEGGLSPAERGLAIARDFLRLRLGPRVLRTETAALVALAALQGIWGDLR
ncbi:MAG: 16S rRNA (uracil(1498)-N(3))-methyltransferase [Gammaproteobacteria bacterium]|nr:16S rRNA (uracil(1498)-N(3))-methyltransferase [Gammaproteobacteria bacterium]